MVNILGIHGFSAQSNHELHDTGISLVKDGKIIFAINEERLTRNKKDGRFPWNSYKLMQNHINLQEIDFIAFADKKPIWQLLNVFKFASQSFIKSRVLLYKYLLETVRRTRFLLRKQPNELKKIPHRFVEHHIAHAASAYYTSPWSSTTIITLDGMGDYCIGGLFGIGINGRIKVLNRLNGFFSPGIFYMILTEYLGFKAGRHEGKITGLAAYGDPEVCYSEMEKIIQYEKGKFNFYSIPLIKTLNKCSLRKICPLTFFDKYWRNYSPEDIAAAAQKRFEIIILDFIEDVLNLTKIRNLVLAGGVFANVKLNQKIKEKFNLRNLYIHPNMTDAGLATGAALYTYYRLFSNNNHYYYPIPIKNIYFGPSYNSENIKKCLKKNKLHFEKINEIELKTANAINNGKIIGHFYGRMEYGPRALGNRSILASAVNSEINKILNDRLNRTEFMPFAPSILEEFADIYIKDWNINQIPSYYMTMTYNVSNQFYNKAPAAIHVDGTTRPQIVNNSINPRLYKILKHYYNLSKIPIVVNTSFNMHEEPIVCTPEDAIKAYQRGATDILILNNYWIEKEK